MVTKEVLYELYVNRGLSSREVARLLGVSHTTVLEKLHKFNIPVRSSRPSLNNSYSVDNSVEALAVEEDYAVNNPAVFQELIIPYPLSSDRDATVTLVMSDLHLGDANFLPNTYWSVINNTAKLMSKLTELYSIKSFKLVLNGDIVAGQAVYPEQELRNLLSRGHWQVFLAEIILKETLNMLPLKLDKLYLVKGTHEGLSNNFVLYLKRVMNGCVKYLGYAGVVNIASPIASFNILFTHGFGKSQYSPISPALLRDCITSVTRYRQLNININRICVSHSHWLLTGYIYDSLVFDVTGGFQKWEYTISQRPSGAIMYVYNNGMVSAIPVKPNPNVYNAELNDPALEYKNIKYYGQMMLKHVKDIEKVSEIFEPA